MRPLVLSDANLHNKISILGHSSSRPDARRRRPVMASRHGYARVATRTGTGYGCHSTARTPAHTTVAYAPPRAPLQRHNNAADPAFRTLPVSRCICGLVRVLAARRPGADLSHAGDRIMGAGGAGRPAVRAELRLAHSPLENLSRATRPSGTVSLRGVDLHLRIRLHGLSWKAW